MEQQRRERYLRRLVRRNFYYTTVEGMTTNFAFGLVNPFLPIYALALGANSLLVSLLTAMPALVNMFVLTPAARMVEARADRVPTVVSWAGVHRSFYVLFALVPFLPAYRAEVVVILFSLMAIPGSISGVAWQALMGDIFPEERRGEIFGLRNMYVGLTGIAASLAAGWFLDVARFPGNFVSLFAVAFAIAAVGLFLMGKLKECPRPAMPRDRGSFVRRARNLFDDPEFGRKYKYFVLSAFVLWFGFGYTSAMWAIYHVNVLHLSNTVIAAFTVLSGASTVASSAYWGRVATRYGNRRVLVISTAGLAVFPALYVLMPNVWYLLAAQTVAGFFTGGINLAVFNLAFDYARPEERASSVAVFNVAINAASFVSPFLGNIWFTHFGIISTFVSGTFIRLISLLLLARIAENRPIGLLGRSRSPRSWRLVRRGFMKRRRNL